MGRKRKNKAIELEEQRYGLFMTDSSFDVDIMFGRHYLNNDVNYKVTIHRVDAIKSKTHKLYGEAKAGDKKFMKPVILDSLVEIADGETKFLANDGIFRDDTGPITVKVYLKELEEKRVEINRGDILEYNISGEKPRYYEVTDAQNVVDITSQTIASFKPYWKRVAGVPAKEDVVNFFNETRK